MVAGDRNREAAAALTGTGRALTALGHMAEAADFHRRGVALHAVQPDPYLRAEAHRDLAYTLDSLGEHSAASLQRAEALGLLAGFTDPRATALSQHLLTQGNPRPRINEYATSPVPSRMSAAAHPCL